MAPVKAPDELAALGLDRRLASRKSPDIRAKENIRYELTQPQKLLTPTGLLMEGQTAFLEHPGSGADGNTDMAMSMTTAGLNGASAAVSVCMITSPV